MNEADANRVLALAEADDEEGLRAAGDEIAPAVEWFLENDRAAAARLVGALYGFWQDEGRVDEGRELTERVAEATIAEAARDEDVARAVPRALLAASELAFRQGDQEQATKRANDTIRAAILIEDRATAALAHTDLARVAYRDGNAPEIEKHARKAMDLAGDDTMAKSGALHMLAWAAHTAGDLDEAERRFEASLDFRRRHRSRLSVAAEISNLGDIAAERGDLPRAARLLAEGLEIGQEVGSTYMLVNTIPSFAVLAVRAGMDEDAARLFGTGRALEQTSGLIPDPNSSVDEAIDTARERLGEARYVELLSEGTMLATDDAVALALDVARRINEGWTS